MMTKKKVEAKVKAEGTLTVENTEEEFMAAEAEFDEKAQAEVAEKLAEAEEEVVAIVKDEVARVKNDTMTIYKKGMKGRVIAELFSDD